MKNPSLQWLLWTRFTLRHWRQSWKESLLLLLILALGIAVFFSIRLANRAAVASFQNFTELIAEESDWILTSRSGGMDESILPVLREKLGPRAVNILPVVEATGARPRQSTNEGIGARETLQIIGVDLMAVRNSANTDERMEAWREKQRHSSQVIDNQLLDRFTHTNAVLVSTAMAVRESLTNGSMLRILINDQPVDILVNGIIPNVEGKPSAPAHLLVMDLPALQSITGRRQIDRVEFICEPGFRYERSRAETRVILTQLDGERFVVRSPSDRRASAEVMTRAFRLNLTILSLIALVVGLYLIFQALDGAVVRRREEIAILRSLGVCEREIRMAWMGEAMMLGLAGGLIGVLLGWLGAQLSVRVVGRTVNALYYATSVNYAALNWSEIGLALIISTASSMTAGWIPAREASNTPPAQVLIRHARALAGPGIWQRPWLGLALLLIAAMMIPLPPIRLSAGGRFPLAGYASALFAIFGGGIWVGSLVAAIARAMRPLSRHSLNFQLAISQLINPSGRHRLACAGLFCAIAMTASMAILVGSFDQTMRGWIERTFQADLYISSDGAQSASSQNRIRKETWTAIATQPEVQEFNALHIQDVELGQGKTMVVGSRFDFMNQYQRLAWVEAPKDHSFLTTGGPNTQVLVSESFSDRFQLRRDQSIAVPTPIGLREVWIAGVFADYGNERGSILMDAARFVEWFKNDAVTSLMLQLKPGADAEAFRSELITRHPGIAAYTNSHLRQEILRIFRQTFSITYALEVIGVVVAVAGLGLTLVSVFFERRNDLATLRALGMTRREMAATAAWEGTLISVAGLIGGLTMSLGLGWILIHVINKQTFGWTLQYALPWNQLLTLGALVVAAGASVAYGVGRWAAVLPADREE